MSCTSPAEILADLMDESRGVCNDEAMMGRKLSTALAYINGLADWAHNKTVVFLNKGMHSTSGIKKIHGQGCSGEQAVCNPQPSTVKRFGDKLIVGCDTYLAVTRTSSLDWEDTDSCVEWPESFRLAVFYLGKALAAGQDQKQLEFALSNQTFLLLISVALDENEDTNWSAESRRIPQVNERVYR